MDERLIELNKAVDKLTVESLTELVKFFAVPTSLDRVTREHINRIRRSRGRVKLLNEDWFRGKKGGPAVAKILELGKKYGQEYVREYLEGIAPMYLK